MDNLLLFAANHFALSLLILAAGSAAFAASRGVSAEAKSWIWLGLILVMLAAPALTFAPANKKPIGGLWLADRIVSAAAAEPGAVDRGERLQRLGRIGRLWRSDSYPEDHNPANSETGGASDAALALQPTRGALSPARLAGWAALGLWFGGFMLGLARYGRRYLNTRALLATASPVGAEDPRRPANWPEALTLLQSPSAPAPLLIGARRPVVLTPPRDEASATAEEEKLLLLHELAHYRRQDHWAAHGLAIAAAAFWWSPALHHAVARYAAAREEACDARAAACASAPETFARALLRAARRMGAAPPLAALSAIGEKALARRIETLLAGRPRAGLAGRAWTLCLWTATASVLLLGAAVAPRAAQAPLPDIETHTPIAAEARNADAERDLTLALLAAAERGDAGSIARLLDLGANPDLMIAGDGTALIIAAREGRLDAVRMLIEHGAAIDLAAPGDGNPLIAAARAGRLEIVRYLIAAGADVNAYVPGDETPLIAAAQEGRLAIAQALIDAGADVNKAVIAPGLARDEMRSPMSVARQFGRTQMIRLLRENGASE